MLKRPDRSICSAEGELFNRRLMEKIGLLYNLFPTAFSSLNSKVFLVVLEAGFFGNQCAYLAFLEVFRANFIKFLSLLTDKRSSPDFSKSES